MNSDRASLAPREERRRARLRDAAVDAVQRGWPVVPGSYAGAGVPTGDLRPAWQNWQECAITDPKRAYRVWDEATLGVLLVCGWGVDAIEAPWWVCELLGGAGLPVPVLPVSEVVPSRRWVLFAATGTGLLHAQLAVDGVRLLGQGSWMALPPTRIGLVHMRWAVPPPRVAPVCCPPPTLCRTFWWRRGTRGSRMSAPTGDAPLERGRHRMMAPWWRTTPPSAAELRRVTVAELLGRRDRERRALRRRPRRRVLVVPRPVQHPSPPTCPPEADTEVTIPMQRYQGSVLLGTEVAGVVGAERVGL